MLNKIVDEFKEESLAIILYGSKIKGYERRESDIDICIVLGSKEKEKIEKVFRKILRIMQNEKIDIKIFELLPLYLKGRILKEGKLLYVKDKKKFWEYVYPVIKVWEDDYIAIRKIEF